MKKIVVCKILLVFFLFSTLSGAEDTSAHHSYPSAYQPVPINIEAPTPHPLHILPCNVFQITDKEKSEFKLYFSLIENSLHVLYMAQAATLLTNCAIVMVMLYRKHVDTQKKSLIKRKRIKKDIDAGSTNSKPGSSSPRSSDDSTDSRSLSIAAD